jgi:7-cyano-7-deazaguanine synthase in queuosine biosynthesis
MTAYAVRTDRSQPFAAALGESVLDWAPGSAAGNIECKLDFFRGWRPTRPAADLLVLAAAAYCADKITSRAKARDAWTRDLGLRVPLHATADFDGDRFARAFAFLTGDTWTVAAYQSTADPLGALPLLAPTLMPNVDVDAVSLFSGGLDSLCGVIDLLETDPNLRLGLVAHYDGGQASSKQEVLYARLAAHYGSSRVVLRRLWLRPAHHDPRQEHPSPPAVETTTRGRSLLFLAAALALASSVGPDAPVYLPENGFIALNVPLTRARTGSASTRTTHPHFLGLLADAVAAMGITNPLVNPYAQSTKGEMLRDSRNPGLLRELAPVTVSCSHPEAARMQERAQGNCGYCFPCLIRRASLAVPGWDDEEYPWDALSDRRLVEEVDEHRGADLRAVVNGVFADRPDSDLLRNAPLPPGSHRDYLSVWRRGNAELRAWLKAGAQGPLADIVERLR